MGIVRFDPFRGFERIARRMNEFSNDLEKGVSFEIGGFQPRVDITDDEKHVLVHAEIPGMSREDVKISVNDDRLMTIKGTKKRPDEEKDRTFIRNERSFGDFSRTFVLPENLDLENIAAKYENGLLEIELNKIEPPKPKEVQISIN